MDPALLKLFQAILPVQQALASDPGALGAATGASSPVPMPPTLPVTPTQAPFSASLTGPTGTPGAAPLSSLFAGSLPIPGSLFGGPGATPLDTHALAKSLPAQLLPLVQKLTQAGGGAQPGMRWGPSAQPLAHQQVPAPVPMPTFYTPPAAAGG